MQVRTYVRINRPQIIHNNLHYFCGLLIFLYQVRMYICIFLSGVYYVHILCSYIHYYLGPGYINISLPKLIRTYMMYVIIQGLFLIFLYQVCTYVHNYIQYRAVLIIILNNIIEEEISNLKRSEGYIFVAEEAYHLVVDEKLAQICDGYVMHIASY